MKKILITHEHELERFSIIGDVDYVRSAIEGDRCDFEEGCYSRPFEDDSITEEQYNENIDRTLVELNNALDPEYLKSVIEEFPKKKNGTFKKNQTTEIYMCDNSQYWEDSYGYNVNVLRFKCIDDNTLELQYFNTVKGY